MSGLRRTGKTRAPGACQGGITVIEILISLLLGMLVIAAVLQLFVSSKVTYNIQDAFGRLQENGRFAAQLLESELRMAGHTGCSTRITVYETNLNNSNAFPYRISNAGNNLGIEGFEANGTGVGDSYSITTFTPATTGGAWAPTLPTADVGAVVVPGTDAVVVRYFSPATARLTTSNSGSNLVVESNTTLEDDDIAAVTDCVKASLFQVTDVSGTGSTRTIQHVGGGTAPGNAVPTWVLPQQQYSAGGEVSALNTVFFYIGQNPRGEPSLYRQRLEGGTLAPAEELVEGVESLQLTYGEDTNGDLAADVYRTANSVADWGSVVSIRAAMLVRSPGAAASDTDSGSYGLLGTQVDPVDDRRLRRVFATTVSLRNRLL